MADAPAAAGVRGTWLLALSALLVGLSLWLAAIGAPLATEAAPQGIVSFELARDAERTAAVLASWDARAREHAMLSLGLDYLYLLVYPAWLAVAIARLGRILGGGWRRAATGLARAVWLAAPLDAVENAALLHQMEHGAGAAAALLAWACAVPKFALVGAGAAFVAAAGAAALARRARAGRRA